MRLGAQLWTVREHTQTLDDFSRTLRKIAGIGYSGVQISGTCGFTAQWLDERLRETGLECMLTDYGNPATCEYFMVNYTVPENAGSSLLFHNHEMEFVQIAADFPHIGFCLDTYWIAGHGQDPAYWIRKLGGRVPAVHLKDMADNGDFAPVYEGVLDFDSILLACRESGVRYLLVEQDDCCGGDPFECLKLSCDNLKARGI